MSKYTPRTEMTPEQSTRERREAKRRKYLAERGTPSRSKDIADIQRHVRRVYYEGGMTSHAMAAQAGVGRDTIMHLINGYRVVQGRRVTTSCLLQSTIDKLWTIRLELPPDHGRAGAHLPPLGTRRRLQALNAMGYDGVWMASQLGICAGNLSALMLGRRGRRYVYAATARRVAAFYDKYQHTDPADVGRSAWHVSTTKTRAGKNGYALPWCWDEETIDDPRTEPEWTGACGTPEGFKIHRREQIPVCSRCRRARRGEADTAPPQDPSVFDPATSGLVVRCRYVGTRRPRALAQTARAAQTQLAA
ncbi:hypothetical protein OTB20_36730 [Streptomyces sp. H27-H1]|uniref:hypothetical protein n=1 Tax=Streptomyces sp. H27-H1 TaxID=2996461 RepID=UPI00226F9BD7|nr:hypothetical protein [Streptomyces sp. H27-H1]MCY0931632.1 hypothetical protein [Streptomyces sp. H27-H1]